VEAEAVMLAAGVEGAHLVETAGQVRTLHVPARRRRRVIHLETSDGVERSSVEEAARGNFGDGRTSFFRLVYFQHFFL
jgi:hypothetical protein